MPQVIQLPTVAETSLGNLGGVLLGAATDYAQNTRADRLRAEQRQQRLADVADERQYQEQRRATLRSEHIEDLNAEQQRALKRELLRLGLITADLLDLPLSDPRVIAGFAEMQKLGLIDRYKEAFKTGDLALSDLGDDARMAAGLAKYSARLKATTERQDTNLVRAEGRANQIAGEEQKLTRQLDAVNASLTAPQPEPSQNEVRSLAIQLAVRQTGKREAQLKPAEINAQLETADATLRERLNMQWAQNIREATIQRDGIVRRLANLPSELNTLASRFGVVGLAEPEVAAPQAPSAPATPSMDRGAVMRSIIKGIRKPQAITPPPVGGAMPGALANPTNEPLIAAENQRTAAGNWLRNLADPFHAAADRETELLAKINELRSGGSVLQPATFGGFGGGPIPVGKDPSIRAQELSQALVELDAVRQEKDKRRRAMLGIDVGAQMPMAAPTAPLQPTTLYDPLD